MRKRRLNRGTPSPRNPLLVRIGMMWLGGLLMLAGAVNANGHASSPGGLLAFTGAIAMVSCAIWATRP